MYLQFSSPNGLLIYLALINSSYPFINDCAWRMLLFLSKKESTCFSHLEPAGLLNLIHGFFPHEGGRMMRELSQVQNGLHPKRIACEKNAVLMIKFKVRMLIEKKCIKRNYVSIYTRLTWVGIPPICIVIKCLNFTSLQDNCTGEWWEVMPFSTHPWLHAFGVWLHLNI